MLPILIYLFSTVPGVWLLRSAPLQSFLQKHFDKGLVGDVHAVCLDIQLLEHIDRQSDGDAFGGLFEVGESGTFDLRWTDIVGHIVCRPKSSLSILVLKGRDCFCCFHRCFSFPDSLRSTVEYDLVIDLCTQSVACCFQIVLRLEAHPKFSTVAEKLR